MLNTIAPYNMTDPWIYNGARLSSPYPTHYSSNEILCDGVKNIALGIFFFYEAAIQHGVENPRKFAAVAAVTRAAHFAMCSIVPKLVTQFYIKCPLGNYSPGLHFFQFKIMPVLGTMTVWYFFNSYICKKARAFNALHPEEFAKMRAAVYKGFLSLGAFYLALSFQTALTW